MALFKRIVSIPYLGSCCRVLCSDNFLTSTKCSTNYFFYRTVIGTVKHYNEKEKRLSSSSVIMQDGHSILEMPYAVQVINGEFDFANNKNENGEASVGMDLQFNHVPKSLFKNIDFDEECEMSVGFMKCNSINEVYNLLTTCPQDEITPKVALSVMKRIFELENNLKYRNEGFKLSSEDSNLTFIRSALVKSLVDTICASSDPQVIVDTLQLLGRDSNMGENLDYVQQICNECIVLASDGKLTVNQVCDIIKSFHALHDVGKEFAEKAWVGINEKQDLNEDEICNIMKVLPLIRSSRMYLFNIVERKLPLLFYNLNSAHILRLAYSLVELKLSSSRILHLITRWTNLNIHKLTEGNLRWIVFTCMYHEHVDDNIQRVLGRYLKAKNINIKDYSLVFTILEYCQKLRIRDPTILKYGCEYYIKHGKEVPASQSSIIMNCFGNLAYIPDKAYEFFSVLEYQIERNFSQFPPSDILSMFLSCLYIRRLPVNFVNKVFDSYFFDRMFVLNDNTYFSCKEKLIILDTVLSLESSVYKGPLLPRSKNYDLTVTFDARAMKYSNEIKPVLMEIFGSNTEIHSSYVLPSLPNINLFVIDCFVDSNRNFGIGNFKMNGKYAFIILMPEHLDLTGAHLLGPQELRKRIFEHFDVKVVFLQYIILRKWLVHPDKLREYIKNELQKIL
ncbi:UNVERIFIED_CONTAM: hypothetical protein RMT77_010682 [Armadillidium vulgare]